MKKNIGLVALIVQMAVAQVVFAQQVSGPGRVWQGSIPFGAPNSSFSPNRDVWVDTLNMVSYIWTGRVWRESAVQVGAGKAGPQGPTGPQGEPGATGAAGVTPTVTVGSVSTLSPGSSATVTSTPTATGVSLSFGIPQGPQGPQGPAGTGSGSGPNIGNVRWVTSWSELNAALLDNNIRSVHLANNIQQGARVNLPKTNTNIKEIEGHGFTWTVPGNIDTAVAKTYASLSEANSGIDNQLRIRNVHFSGTGRTTVMLGIQATYGSRIEGCRFYNFKVGYYGGWTMGTVIDQCYFWENDISIFADYARFSGGSNFTSQSNHFIIRDCKFRHSAGQFGAVRVEGASGVQVTHNIFEGVGGNQYMVYFDDRSSTVVKEFICSYNHYEADVTVAFNYCRMREGIALFQGNYNQKVAPNFIVFESSAWGRCCVRDMMYLVSNVKFKSVLTTCRWFFDNMPTNFSALDQAWWDGAIPSNSKQEGTDSNGQTPYINLGTRRL